SLHDLPEALDESRVISVATLADDRGDGGRFPQRQPPADRRTVVLDVYGVSVDTEGSQQARREVCQRIEGVVELLDRWGVGEPEAQVIRRDHVVAVGKGRYQVAKHIRARRKSV